MIEIASFFERAKIEVSFELSNGKEGMRNLECYEFNSW